MGPNEIMVVYVDPLGEVGLGALATSDRVGWVRVEISLHGMQPYI